MDPRRMSAGLILDRFQLAFGAASFGRSWVVTGLMLVLCTLVFIGCGEDDPLTVEPSNPADALLYRLHWYWASVPVHGADDNYVSQVGDSRLYDAADRVETVRWFPPKTSLLAWHLNPDLTGEARDETVGSMALFFRADDQDWAEEDWAGIMTGWKPPDMSVSSLDHFDIWINDFEPQLENRSGTLHIDLGLIDEDCFWPSSNLDGLVVGWFEREDGILSGDTPDGLWTVDEDVGLDGEGCSGPQRYDATYSSDLDPYPWINGTACNNRNDTEDLDGDTAFNRRNRFITCAIDLRDTEPVVDVVRDYDDVDDLVENGFAWRRYRVAIEDFMTISDRKSWDDPVTFSHIRIWFEDDSDSAPWRKNLQLAEFKFVDYE